MTAATRTAPPWPAVKALFDRVVELPPLARETLLGAEAEAADTVAEVRALLRQHEAEEHGAAGFLATPPTLLHTPPPERRGQRLGPWVLTGRLGAGGMGEVWAAQRADGAYEAQVAVKVLHARLAGSALTQRFQQEQRTLARFDHPHIARLLDAGSTPDGAPYFVLEAVHGRPIDEACRGQPLAARLRLMLQLCDAVAYAHRNLLVHRDLKPANVLVTAAGQVKLLDFGIAQAPQAGGTVAPDAPDAPGVAIGVAIAIGVGMTPGFASPEQVRGEPLGTASDVYALGVLLYLLLTGVRPYGRAADNPADALHAALHETVLPPSAAPLPAEAERSVARTLLKGDLDAIVLRALARRIEDRYASVDALAADLRAHLAVAPVAARGGTWRYRSSRFVRRHRTAVSLALSGLVALLLALGGLALQVHKTEVARRDAEARFAELRQLANRLVFNYHDRIVNLAGALPAREALLGDALGYLDGLARSAPRDPQLARELAQTYHRVAVLYGETFSANLGRIAAAEASLDKALALQPLYIGRAGLPATAYYEAADMWLMRSQLHARQGRLRPALQALDDAQPLVQHALALAPDDLQVLSRQATLAGRRAQALGGSPTLANLGQVAEAGVQGQLAIGIFERLVRREPEAAEWKHQLGWALASQVAWALIDGRFDLARASSQRLIDLRQAAAALRPDDGHLRYQAAVAWLNRATALSYGGEHAAAMAALEHGRSTIAAVAQAEPANRSAARDLLLIEITRGRMLVLAGQHDAAQPVLHKAIDALQVAEGDFFLGRWRAEARLWLARALSQTQPHAALAQAQAAADAMRSRDAQDADNAARRWMLAQALGEQAPALQALGRHEEAAAAARAALREWGDTVPGGMAHWAARDRLLAGVHR